MRLKLFDLDVVGFYAYPSVVLDAILECPMDGHDGYWNGVRDLLIKKASVNNIVANNDYKSKPHLDNKIAFKVRQVDRQGENYFFISFKDGIVKIGFSVTYEFKPFTHWIDYANGTTIKGC